MPTFRHNDAELFYRDEGRGAPLVLLHAFPLSHAMWDAQIQVLSARRRVITPDTRGFGQSTLGSAAPTMDSYADDVAALLDHLGLERVMLGGLSMGGYIAFAFLRRHATRLHGLILANTRALPDSEAARQGRETNAVLAETQGTTPIAEAMLPRLLSPNASEAVQQQVRKLILANSGSGIAAALRAMAGRPDSTPQLAEIAVPTLVIGAELDPLIPLDEIRTMAAAIPGSRLEEISGVGHLSNLEAPEAFTAVLEEL